MLLFFKVKNRAKNRKKKIEKPIMASFRYKSADDYVENNHLGAYTLLNPTSSKSKVGLKIERIELPEQICIQSLISIE